MTQLVWDQVGSRFYETGVDRGVLYIPDNNGVYVTGVAWNGLTSISESPSGAEPTAQYADNIKYLNLTSAEEFAATLEAYTYPVEFQPFDGLGVPTPGVAVGQQARKSFGLSYRTLKGNDLEGQDYGYKIHLAYGLTAAPSEKAFATVNDSPEAITFSWSLSSNPVPVPGYKPTAIMTIDSTQVNATKLTQLETILYGATGVDPVLPTPGFVITHFSGSVVTVVPTQPSFNTGTDTITIPAVTGVTYRIGGSPVAAGPVVITEDTIVTATPNSGYVFADNVDDDWLYEV
jgi:hypothetical protein